MGWLSVRPWPHRSGSLGLLLPCANRPPGAAKRPLEPAVTALSAFFFALQDDRGDRSTSWGAFSVLHKFAADVLSEGNASFFSPPFAALPFPARRDDVAAGRTPWTATYRPYTFFLDLPYFCKVLYCLLLTCPIA